MDDHNRNNETVEINFEIGHSSIIRSEATTTHNPPRTHDWKVYLRSSDVNGDLSCLIQRCVFHLHHEFPNNKRELKTTPFAIQESGYAGFRLPIEIYFKRRKEPKKFLIDYDLDLHQNTNGHPFRQKESYVRKYCFSFSNPDPEFRQKILAAGGKIVDIGPIPSNNTDIADTNMAEEQISSHESIIRHSPQQKRPISPSSTPNIVNKKAKIEQSTNNIKKKPIQTVIKNENPTKTTVTIKKPKLVSCKSSSMAEEKIPKTSAIKEPIQSIAMTENTDNLLLSKPRPVKKLIKSQSTNDMKSSSQPITINIKKKDITSPPSKTKTIINSQNVIKKSITKKPLKTSIKIEQTSTPTVKSPSNIKVKQESLSQPPPPPPPPPPPTIISSNNTTTTVSINTLKKIPKKPVSSLDVEKRSRSTMPASSQSRDSTRDLQRQQQQQQPKSSKTKSNLKQNRSSSTINSSRSSNRPEKTNTTTKDRPNPNSSRHDQLDRSSLSPHKPSSNSQKHQLLIPSKSIRSPSQSHNEPSINSNISSSIDTSQPSSISSPPIHVFPNEDNYIQSFIDIDRQNNENSIQFSDTSNSPHEPSLIQQNNTITINQICYSDQSDTNDSDPLQDNNSEEEDLPSSLTNDDLRYKLIYIYNRFQLNSTNDLIIFVRFFKRHQLIDISTLSMTQKPDEMFTYDLFSLSPSHIGELANDLGYTTTNIINSMEQ